MKRTISHLLVVVLLLCCFVPITARAEGRKYNFNWEEESFALPYLPSDMQWKTVLTTDPADPAAKEAGGCPKEAAQERLMVLPGRCVAILEGIKI